MKYFITISIIIGIEKNHFELETRPQYLKQIQTGEIEIFSSFIQYRSIFKIDDLESACGF